MKRADLLMGSHTLIFYSFVNYLEKATAINGEEKTGFGMRFC